ncbi:MAG: sulfotransferase family protein, partial [Candidatus Diapherotrites archaeon]|nr:sulfotransferase family protein [Candidatus Diapherotrites archaeon]
MKYHDKSNHITYDTQISYAYDRPAIAFIHIPKTAGSSLHYLFKEKFGAEKVSPLFNDLHLLPISFTYLYDVIFGHMDYEIAKLTIQRKDVKLITFLRDPIKRLISVYRFWWSHDPELHKGNFAVELANKYSPEEFFNTEEVKDSLWNEMFAKFMGCKFRDTVKRTLSLLNERSKQIYIETVLKPLIHERIKDYFYIGMQDNFAQDVIEMFNKLEIPCTKEDIEKARVNITDENIGKHGFKNIKPDFQITDKVISSISELTELDMLLYE